MSMCRDILFLEDNEEFATRKLGPLVNADAR